MEAARLKARAGARWLLGGIALAALVLGGCAAPQTEEQARFATLAGRVTDAQSRPIPGAEVSVVPTAGGGSIGTRNYSGVTGPFFTDANGGFSIGGLQVIPSDPVVVNLRVSRAGFAPAFVLMVPSANMTVAGAQIVAGVATPDIVITDPLPTQVRATLTPISPGASVDAAGG